MMISKVSIIRHPKKSGYFLMTFCNDCDAPTEVKIELPLSEIALRHVRESADRALQNKAPLNIEFLSKRED